MPNNYNTASTSGIFTGLKTPRDLLEYNLMFGVTDFSNLEQFDYYEKGYPFLIVTGIPQFLEDLAEINSDAKMLVNNYVHALEKDFKGLEGVDNITGESNGEISNGLRSIQIINKVLKPATTTITMQYVERSGSLFTKGNEFYLTGVKDPDTGGKHYHGLVDLHKQGIKSTTSAKDPGPHQEVFEFLYFTTDNTICNVERAFCFAAAQPNLADFSTLYNGEKGQYEFPTIQMSFNCFVINNNMVYVKAQKALMAMRNQLNKTSSRLVIDSNNFRYDAIDHINVAKDGDKNTDSTYVLDSNTITADGKWGSNVTNENYVENGSRNKSINSKTYMKNYTDKLGNLSNSQSEHMIIYNDGNKPTETRSE